MNMRRASVEQLKMQKIMRTLPPKHLVVLNILKRILIGMNVNFNSVDMVIKPKRFICLNVQMVVGKRKLWSFWIMIVREKKFMTMIG